MHIKLTRQIGHHPPGTVLEVVNVIPHGGHTDEPFQYLTTDGTYVYASAALAWPEVVDLSVSAPPGRRFVSQMALYTAFLRLSALADDHAARTVLSHAKTREAALALQRGALEFAAEVVCSLGDVNTPPARSANVEKLLLDLAKEFTP